MAGIALSFRRENLGTRIARLSVRSAGLGFGLSLMVLAAASIPAAALAQEQPPAAVEPHEPRSTDIPPIPTDKPPIPDDKPPIPDGKPPVPDTTVSAEPPAPAASRGEVYEQFREHFAARRFTEALPAAEQVVVLTEAQYGADRSELIKPLTNLGTTQLRLNNLYGAETAYRRALRIAEARAGGYSRDVIEPLHGLGLAQYQAGQFENSAETLRRAVDVSRKLDGLFNIQQLPLVESLVDSYIALDKTSDVDREQQYALRLSETAYGRDDPRMVPALERNAQWCESTSRYRMARKAHARSLEILGRSAGKRDPVVVGPLRGIARTYRMEFLYGTSDTDPEGREFSPALTGTLGGTQQAQEVRATRLDPDGEAALKLALSVLADRKDLPGLRGETLLDLGEWYQVGSKQGQAIRTYRDAWAALSTAGGPGTAAMSQPVQIFYRPPSSATKRPDKDDDEMRENFVEVEFTVTAEGRVSNARTVATDGSESQQKSVEIAARRARYRPRFVDGNPVATTGVRQRQILYSVIQSSRPRA